MLFERLGLAEVASALLGHHLTGQSRLVITIFAWFFPVGCAFGAEGLVVGQARLGNVFVSGEVVQIPVRAKGDRVAWRVEDFFGTEVATGVASVAHGNAVIEPRIGRPGYFELHLEAPDGDAPAAAKTSFAVIAPPPALAPQEVPFGVMTHFAQGWDTDLMPLIAKAGIRHIRDEQYWKRVEPEPGRYAFPPSYQAYVADALASGIAPLIEMTFANPHYDDGLTPYTDAGREGYARYGLALLDQYGDAVQALEVWNEYNGSFAKGPAAKDRPAHYAKMLAQAYRRMKAVRPDVTVLGGATVLMPLPYLEELFRLGALDHMDGVAVHPYRARPEGVERDLAALRALIGRYDGGVPKPIWATEFGRHDDSPGGRRRTASYLVRMATLLLGGGVERMYWYLMRDYLGFQSMGLVRAPDGPFGRYAPAPAYVAYANLIRQLARARYVRREATDPRTQIHLFARDGEEVRVSWAPAGASVGYVTDVPLTVVDIVGNAREAAPVGGEVRLVLGANPVYVQGPVRALREHRSDAVVASSERDFAQQQGAAGWRYGAFDGDGQGEGDGAAPMGAYTDDDFEPLVTTEDAWKRYWGAHGLGPVAVSESNAHPSAVAGRPVWAVRRWVSDVGGPAQISGTIGAGAKGDGTRAVILVDGVQAFAADVGGPAHERQRDYALPVTLERGVVVDFALTPGPGTDVNFDATTFTALITVPLAAAATDRGGT